LCNEGLNYFLKGITVKTSNEFNPRDTQQREKLQRTELYEVLNQAKISEEPIVFSPLFSSTEKQVSFISVLEEISEDFIFFKNPVPLNLIAKFSECTGYTMFVRTYLLQSEKIQSQGTMLKFPIPEYAQQNQMRTEERTYYSSKLKNYVLIKHPFDQGTTLKRRLLDISKGGLSFCAPVESAFIRVGRSLPLVKVYISDKLFLETSAQIVYSKKIIDTTTETPTSLVQVGLKFPNPQLQEKSE
jgi:hypothetical protein